MALTKGDMTALRMEARNLTDLVKETVLKLKETDTTHPACYLKSGFFDVQQALDKFTKAEKLLK